MKVLSFVVYCIFHKVASKDAVRKIKYSFVNSYACYMVFVHVYMCVCVCVYARL